MAGITYFYSHDFQEFVEQIVWFSSEERRGVKYPFLAFLMANGTDEAYEHARQVFGFTDEDFREALRQAKPGVFRYPKEWEQWNAKLGFIPALPFPRINWDDVLRGG